MAFRIMSAAALLVALTQADGAFEDAVRAMHDADAPFSVSRRPRDPAPNVTLRAILEPFAAERFEAPFAKFTHGAGEAADEATAPRGVDEAIGMITHPREPTSIVLRLEELAPREVPAAFHPWLAPFSPLSNGTTAHVYVSSEGGSALANHTDVTEILVVQLLGRKEWLHCREKSNLAPFLAVSEKLDRCTTYSAAEMDALECDRTTTAPGDVLYLGVRPQYRRNINRWRDDLRQVSRGLLPRRRSMCALRSGLY